MPQDVDPKEIPEGVVLRLLNGALRGGEFLLGSGTSLFVLSPPAALQREAGQPDFPDNAFFVPVDEGGNNFEIEVTVAEGLLQAGIRELDALAQQSPYVFNTVRRIGVLAIAMRPQAQMWSAEVLRYPADAPSALPREALPPLARPIRLQRIGARIKSALAALLLTGLLAGIAAALWLRSDAPPGTKAQLAQMSQLSDLLIGAIGQYRILPGRDGLMYVFAADDRDAAWARQAVARSTHAAKTRIVQQSEELARIVRLLNDRRRVLAYHVLRMNDPARPVLLISPERSSLDAAGQEDLTCCLKDWLPYAEFVSVETLADAEVARRAEEGLERLGVRHRKIEHEGGTTMAIHGALADGELQKIRTFIEAFYRQWGTQYIHFSVEMADDCRKGKSFEYGGGGYVKSGASHWDFSV